MMKSTKEEKSFCGLYCCAKYYILQYYM